MTIPNKESVEPYNVLVDFTTGELTSDEIAEQFSHAIHVEEIRANQCQIGLGVFASTGAEAYRRAVNTVEAELAMLNHTESSVLGAEVYGSDGSKVML